jgi:protein-tyrosine phosphatase
LGKSAVGPVIDLHTHILPGLDDGARNLEQSVAMARSAVADGVRVLAATPHVREDYPTRAAQMERGVVEVREALAAEGVDIELLAGGEIALDQLEVLEPDELARFGLGGNPRYLLLEFPYSGWPLDLEARAFELRGQGFAVVLAHPERNSEVQAAPERLRRLAEQGALIQLTSASVDGRLGRASKRSAFQLLELGIAHLIASDAHTPEIRAVGMSGAADAVGDIGLARWLTEEMPAAIVSGEVAPARPPRRRSPFGRLFRKRRGPV